METPNVIPLSTHFEVVEQLQQHLNQRIFGQPKLIHRLIVALLCDGHILVEGAPGLAKTRAIKELALVVEGNFHRIQFTPDLLPADLTGTDIFRQETGEFVFQEGPLFHSFVLADEINRAPAKVQSALLEAMAERQITIGRKTYPLPEIFMVMATQNPIEQEGTYPLPEAQLDRFLLYTKVDYPDAINEEAILRAANAEALLPQKQNHTSPNLSQKALMAIRKEVLSVHMSEPLEKYLVQLILATRRPEPYGLELQSWIHYGASPRATIGLHRASQACAWLKNRDYVLPEDIHEIAHDILRHRIILHYEAQAEGITRDKFITEILNRVAIP